MGDIDKGDAKLTLQFGQHALHADDQMGIECRERFVEQQNLWFGDKCPRQCNTLTLAARQGIDIALGKLGDAETVEPVHGFLAPRRLVQSTHL